MLSLAGVDMHDAYVMPLFILLNLAMPLAAHVHGSANHASSQVKVIHLLKGSTSHQSRMAHSLVLRDNLLYYT